MCMSWNLDFEIFVNFTKFYITVVDFRNDPDLDVVYHFNITKLNIVLGGVLSLVVSAVNIVCNITLMSF